MTSNVVAFQSLGELDAEGRVQNFVSLARDQLTNLVDAEGWRGDVWDVTDSFVRKGKNRARSRLHFFRHRTLEGRGDDATGTPFEPAFGQFARAFIRFDHSAAPKVFERFKARLWALAHIEAAFLSLGMAPQIHLLSPQVLSAAVGIAGAGVEDQARYQRATIIQGIYEFCLGQHLIATAFTWKHGIAKVADPGERVGPEFAKRRAKKLPSRRALEVLAHVYRNPQNLRDKLFSALSLVCVCAPWRVHEVLQLRTDCVVREDREVGATKVSSCGLRAYPGKGKPPQVKWTLDIAADQLEEAVARLRDASSDARAIAAWYSANPTSLYLPPEFEHLRAAEWINSDDIADLFGQLNGMQVARRLKLEPMSRARDNTLFRFRFADLERAVLALLPNDFPYQNGSRDLPYADALVMARAGALRADTVGDGSAVMFDVADIDQFNRWLSGTTDHTSVFERYNFAEDDGSPIEITSHAFRHWNSNLGHRGGLTQEDLALWAGRDPGQNKYYDHRTPAEFREDLRERALKVGGVGPVFEAADNLSPDSIITREEFLSAQIGSAHVTEFGACIHDYALQPCPNHGDCVTCEENVFAKGDQRHRAEIARLLGLLELQLEAAKAALSEEHYGADLWVEDHEHRAERMRMMLRVHDVRIPMMSPSHSGSMSPTVPI